MRELTIIKSYHFKLISLLFLWSVFSANVKAQTLSDSDLKFWDRVQFGGAIGLGFGNGYFNGTLSPAALYNFNRYAALGTALNFSYVYERNFYDSYVVGFSLLGVFHPIPELQLSVEPQQSFVSRNFDPITGFQDENYWVGALFLGIGYSTGNDNSSTIVTFGIQYDVLYDPARSIYGDSWFPFVRVWF